MLQFEASENKPVVIGYIVGAVAAFIFAEWFIHLPLFNIVSCACHYSAHAVVCKLDDTSNVWGLLAAPNDQTSEPAMHSRSWSASRFSCWAC